MILYHQNPLIGIKGRLQSFSYEDENGKKHFVTEVVAERVTFLSTTKKDVVNEEVKKSSKNKKKAE